VIALNLAPFVNTSDTDATESKLRVDMEFNTAESPANTVLFGCSVREYQLHRGPKGDWSLTPDH
jgi:hypothetical protein